VYNTCPNTDYDRSKQSENEKYSNHFGSVINNAILREIKSRFAITKAAFKKKKKDEEALFTN